MKIQQHLPGGSKVEQDLAGLYTRYRHSNYLKPVAYGTGKETRIHFRKVSQCVENLSDYFTAIISTMG